jgi:predicted ATPase
MRVFEKKFISQRDRDNFKYPMGVYLKDLKHNVEVSHRDVGVGISQMLPVLVHALGSRDSLLMVEQPELHLHPQLQAVMADVFIESALGGNRNRCLLETHSEHLILRIMRRIREQSKKQNPTIKASDVAVLYVMPDKDGSKIVQIRIDDDGEFLDPWPGGFFPERLEELI